MKPIFAYLWKEKTGGNLTEYALLLALLFLTIGAIVIGFASATGKSFSKASHGVANSNAGSGSRPTPPGMTLTSGAGITAVVSKSHHFSFQLPMHLPKSGF